MADSGLRPDAIADARAVRLLELPVPLWAQSQEHHDELVREFTLIAGSDPAVEHEIPARLTRLIAEVAGQYGQFGGGQQLALADAAAAGLDSLDLIFHVPPQVAGAARHLGELLEEADDYCRGGRHLLTLATPPELAAFRCWYLGEFSAQIGGAEPTSWPRWRGRQD